MFRQNLLFSFPEEYKIIVNVIKWLSAFIVVGEGLLSYVYKGGIL